MIKAPYTFLNPALTFTFEQKGGGKQGGWGKAGCRFCSGLGFSLGIGIGFFFRSPGGHAPPLRGRKKKPMPMPRLRLRPRPLKNLHPAFPRAPSYVGPLLRSPYTSLCQIKLKRRPRQRGVAAAAAAAIQQRQANPAKPFKTPDCGAGALRTEGPWGKLDVEWPWP